MNSPDIITKPYGEHGLLIEWPEEVSETILKNILNFESYLRKNNLLNHDWELVPSYNSLLFVNRKEHINFNEFSKEVLNWYQTVKSNNQTEQFLWRLPVCYDLEFALDLQEVAAYVAKTTTEIIAMHTAATYTVYGIGFLPGFMYLGGVDENLEVPRKATPRLKVVSGAVGIAGKQAGIYPQESPGGWNIIGNCSIPIFDANREEPCFVKVGDKIQFYQVSKAEYELHKIEAQLGIYKIEKIKIDA